MANPFVNRIVNYGTKPADQFEANPLNYRIHPQRQRDAVRASLRELGWIGVVVENKRTGRLIDGHERVWQALENNEPVPYIEVDLSEEEERLALAVFDPITYMAETDAQVLDELLREVDTGEAALQELLAELAEDAGLYVDEAQPIADVAPQMDKAEELRQKWQVESGQLWQLGDHRLICGDCTDPDVVARVMGGEKADMVFTDPPYALFGNSTGVAGIVDDKMVRPFFRDIVKLSIGNTKMFAHVYICCDWHSAFVIYDIATSNGLTAKNLCVWDKGDGGLGANYQQCYELVWFFSNSPKRVGTLGTKATGERVVHGVGNIWRFPRVTSERIHNAEKPVDMVSVPIRCGCDDGEIVADWFSGSGTTIIACEQLGRKCRAIEISPAYVAVAIDRWATATGKTPVLLGGANG